MRKRQNELKPQDFLFMEESLPLVTGANLYEPAEEEDSEFLAVCLECSSEFAADIGTDECPNCGGSDLDLL